MLSWLASGILPHLLRSYATYYNQAWTHLSVKKDAPSPRAIHAIGRICRRHSSADFTVCMCEFDFRHAQRELIFHNRREEARPRIFELIQEMH